jgi:hypothetical protein
MGQSVGDVVARALLVGEVAGLVAAYRLSPGFGSISSRGAVAFVAIRYVTMPFRTA